MYWFKEGGNGDRRRAAIEGIRTRQLATGVDINSLVAIIDLNDVD